MLEGSDGGADQDGVIGLQSLYEDVDGSRTSAMSSVGSECSEVQTQSAVRVKAHAPSQPALLRRLSSASVPEDVKPQESTRSVPRRLSVSSSRRASLGDLLSRNRRASVGGDRSRRPSAVPSRRASVQASRRGSLSGLSEGFLQSTFGQYSSLSAATAFLLTDVTAEPNILQGAGVQRPARMRASSTWATRGGGARPPPQPQHTEHNLQPLALMRGSFLGAINGEPDASSKLRASLTRTCNAGDAVAPSRRASTSSMRVQNSSCGRQQAGHAFPSRRGSCGSVSAAVESLGRRGSGDTESEEVNQLLLRCLERRGSIPTLSRAPERASLLRPSVDSGPLTSAPVSIAASKDSLAKPHNHAGKTTVHSSVFRERVATRLRNSETSIPSSEESSVEPNLYCCWCWCCACLCARYDQSTVVIHPLSRLRLYWDGLVATLSVWTLFEMPMRVVFSPEQRFDFSRASSLNYLAIVVLYLQPVVASRTIVVVRGTPEIRPTEILKHYIGSLWFIVDVASAACALLDFAWPTFALGGAVRLLYAVQFVNKLEKATKTSPSLIRSVQCLLVVMPSLHWFACVFCYLALVPGSWLEEYQQTRGEQLNTSSMQIYLHAIYWTLDTASTRGSGEINVTSDLEVLLMCVIIALGTLMYSAIIANASTLLLSSDSTWNDHRRRVEVLKAFMRHRKLPTRLRQRIQNYLDYSWSTHKGINEQQILHELPLSLQKQVTLFCAQGIISKVPLFRGCSTDASASIIASLENRVYVPHDLIIERGVRGDEFFIVSEGVVVQLDETGCVPLAYLHAGSYFGELAALLGGQQRESILALTHCFLYSLNHAALEDILHRHPECIDNMLANMVNAYDLHDITARLVELESSQTDHSHPPPSGSGSQSPHPLEEHAGGTVEGN
jgi:hypothetical protein